MRTTVNGGCERGLDYFEPAFDYLLFGSLNCPEPHRLRNLCEQVQEKAAFSRNARALAACRLVYTEAVAGSGDHTRQKDSSVFHGKRDRRAARKIP
jgi:hypothetical protein